MHFIPSNIVLDNKSHPSLVRVTVKQSKLILFGGYWHLCGAYQQGYLPGGSAVRLPGSQMLEAGPLFIFSNGRMLTRQCFVNRVRNSLAEIGVDQAAYRGHSFCIGASITTVTKEVEDYIKIHREQLTEYLVVLAS